MYLSQILSHKGSDVVTIRPGATVLEAIRLLVDRNIGALVVVKEGDPVGILSERDVLTFTAGGPGLLADTRVGDLMTRDMITAEPRDSISHAMNVMTKRRIRHLPILNDGALVGIVSIGDVVNALRDETVEENHHLKAYIASAG
ncbi:MAG TPA: CBS domain-containing protein [Longimicrobiales bacterium]|nr:CBS domain-containing protein [Longimicrobiales bacterium]